MSTPDENGFVTCDALTDLIVRCAELCQRMAAGTRAIGLNVIRSCYRIDDVDTRTVTILVVFKVPGVDTEWAMCCRCCVDMPDAAMAKSFHATLRRRDRELYGIGPENLNDPCPDNDVVVPAAVVAAVAAIPVE